MEVKEFVKLNIQKAESRVSGHRLKQIEAVNNHQDFYYYEIPNLQIVTAYK